MTQPALTVAIPDELVEALAQRVLERIGAELDRRRWAEIEGVAEYLGCTVRRVRELRERGMPAKKAGRRLLFDLRAVDRWLEEEQWAA